MTDNDKLNLIQEMLKRKISELATLADFKDFVKNITSGKIRKAIKEELQKDIDLSNENMTNEQGKVDSLTIFKDEMDKL